jgi:hypothetical protein
MLCHVMGIAHVQTAIWNFGVEPSQSRNRKPSSWLCHESNPGGNGEGPPAPAHGE